MAERLSARQRGYTTAWDKARRGYLASNPLCVMCAKIGRTTAATVVNHKIAHRGDQKLFWDKSNWEALCQPHHDSDAQRIDNGGKPRLQIDVSGWPIEG